MWVSHLSNRYNVVLILQLLCVLPENGIHVRANVCELGQEKDKHNGGRWFLSDKDQCSCKSIRLGGFNAHTTGRSFDPEYMESPSVGDGEDKIRNHYHLNCNEGITSNGTTFEETTSEESTSEATTSEGTTSDGSNSKKTTEMFEGTTSEETTSEKTASEGTTSEGTDSVTTFYQTSFKDATSHEATTLANACSQPMPLGMEDRTISDAQLSASSYYDSRYTPSEGRLNNNEPWGTASGDTNMWFQVDFLSAVTITKIITQGNTHNTYINWITTLQIAFGDSASSLSLIRDDGNSIITFTANTDQNTAVSIDRPEPISTQILRIIPTTWYQYDWSPLRLEVVGCK
ncbi:uncharacterized protein [Amphiura filiformis]|uniref:uncharacterized protein n=1 Tax=Amphiura filiformis TaxID=82378 RepID=UPI003B214506